VRSVEIPNSSFNSGIELHMYCFLLAVISIFQTLLPYKLTNLRMTSEVRELTKQAELQDAELRLPPPSLCSVPFLAAVVANTNLG
jgi:hypothetical protein